MSAMWVGWVEVRCAGGGMVGADVAVVAGIGSGTGAEVVGCSVACLLEVAVCEEFGSGAGTV